jgi:predicted O-linked N-acetylglucosamine transferase (SPINDLY family)
MGVPVVALAGEPSFSRVGASILNAAALGEDWAPSTDAGYVKVAGCWFDQKA